MFRKVDPKKALPEVEHEVLKMWQEKGIFKKSLEKNKKAEKYVFFDGPPFANGLPHYGHIMANALKDAVTRYATMRGYYVPRTNGWDCHGLPVEYEIEKELKLSGRKDIEEFGIGNFNKKCRESVFRYTREWGRLFDRIGRWVDFNETYATLDNSYMESIWWVFRQIWDKGLVYEGHKAMHICPRCSTPLSNFEVSLGYKDVTDLSIVMKFELEDEPGSYFLAWTTTAWSCLSVMGLAIRKDINYVKVKAGDAFYYLAEKRVEELFQGTGVEYEIVERFKGDRIHGKKYRHLFDFYYDHPEVKASKNVFTTQYADYVSDDDGTGIVTINGAFGEVDMESAKCYGLPIILNVSMNGEFTSECGKYAGKFVKGQEQNIAADLQERGLLFKKENYRHSYPHCWRCDTPLLNYATSSWFVKVTDIKDQLLAHNEKINWQPAHIRDGRFGKWLENVRDWAISRNRFWGAAIPVWKCQSCEEKICISSVDELSKMTKDGIRLIAVRHGEYEGNVDGTLHSDPSEQLPLTKKGREQAEKLAKKLDKVDVIISSELLRSRQTAEVIAQKFGLKVEVEPLVNEFFFGELEGQPVDSHTGLFESVDDYLTRKPVPNAETFSEVIERFRKFFRRLRQEYKGKTVLLVTHGSPILALEAALGRISDRHAALLSLRHKMPKNCESKEFFVGNEPVNEEGNVDLHKPYIDNVYLDCPQCGDRMLRIEEVFDCWFESGAMPYAQLHYPFEEKKEFEDNFPAHFIAEGLDQTRGWFYTLHVLAGILFDSPAFRNVIVNGILLAADGEKLSKRKKNYPDPYELFESKGVDSTRFFLYSSTAPLAEDVRFSEAHVEDILKKVTLTLWNTYSFFVTYAAIDKWQPEKKKIKPENKLDRWILSELHELIREMTEAMEAYNLTEATRPMIAFVDNLSNWYVRRCRRRFWKSENDSDKNQAYAVLYEVLTTLSRLLAPFMPFLSDEIYTNLTGEESVHLCDWPNFDNKMIDRSLNYEIFVIRKIVELGHRSRANHKIKVRQPLRKVFIALPHNIKKPADDSIILEELNVKELEFVKDSQKIAKPVVKLNFAKVAAGLGAKTKIVTAALKDGNYEILESGKVKVADDDELIFDPQHEEVFIGYEAVSAGGDLDISSEGGIVVALYTEITDTLRKEGIARDLIRYTQELRKKAAFNVDDRIYLFIKSPDYGKIVEEYADFIMKETLALEIQQTGNFEWDMEEKYQVEGKEVTIAVRRQGS